MKTYRRTQLLVDRPVQGTLLLRTVAYWLYCLLAVAMMASCWIIVRDRPATSGELLTQIWLHSGPALFGSFLVLPIVVLDCLRLSNRFAGPIFRLQRAMTQLADGQPVRKVHFRDGDYLHDLADVFNRLVDRVDAHVEHANSGTPASGTQDVDRLYDVSDLLDEFEYEDSRLSDWEYDGEFEYDFGLYDDDLETPEHVSTDWELDGEQQDDTERVVAIAR